MLSTDSLRPLHPGDRLIIDQAGNVVGIQNQNSRGQDMRVDATVQNAAPYNPANVAITGGTINGIPTASLGIGSYNPASVAITGGTISGVSSVAVAGMLSATGTAAVGVASNPTGAGLYVRNATDQNIEVLAPGLSATGIRLLSRSNAGVATTVEIQGSAVKMVDGAGTPRALVDTTGLAVTGALSASGLISPQQAAAAPAYVKGAMYFDTTLNKLRIGGATAWETVTST